MLRGVRSYLKNMAMPFGFLAFTLYFLFFLIYGERSLTRLHILEKEIASQQIEQHHYQKKREKLENRISGLREETLDLDLLDERVRFMLHYGEKEDLTLISNTPSVHKPAR